MNSFEQDFRKFLTEAELGQYVDDGQVTLYHYTKNPSESLVLDPNYKKSHYSSKEFEVAQTPRVFFYTDPKQRETFFRAGIPLFTTKVDAGRIYDFKNDPEGYVEKNRHKMTKTAKQHTNMPNSMVVWNFFIHKVEKYTNCICSSTNNQPY